MKLFGKMLVSKKKMITFAAKFKKHPVIVKLKILKLCIGHLN